MLRWTCCCLALSAAAATAHEAADRPLCQLTIELVDAASGTPLAGVISVRDESGEVVPLSELTPRGLGVGDGYAIHDWFLLPAPRTVAVPQQPLTLRGFHGLTTEMGEAKVDLRNKSQARVQIALRPFYDTRLRGWQSANTHVHLQKVGRQQSERYLLEVAAADALETVYISYLERAEADLQYTTNKYSAADLLRLSRTSAEQGGAEFDNGQEHRHNFAGFGEGYGHVMFLHLRELVRPVSIGPGIMRQGIDSPALRPGIERTRGQGATVIWCHNQWGLEDVPSWVGGKLHANNIFDGGTHGSFRHSFYRYLNAGIEVPFSSGTDWFVYDFSRAYVRGEPGEVGAGKRLSSEQWLARLAEGRSYITNGPLLELLVDEAAPGDRLQLDAPRAVTVTARAAGRVDFGRIELVRNGRVVRTAASEGDGHFVAQIKHQLTADGPCWIALRTPPPSTKRDADLQRKTPLNEYGRELFSHTSPVYVDIGGRRVFDQAAADDLIEDMRRSIETIRTQATLKNERQRKAIVAIYEQAIQKLTAAAGKQATPAAGKSPSEP